MSKLIGNQEFSGSTFILGVGSYNGANPSAGTNDVASVLEGIGGKQEFKSGQTISYRKTNVNWDAGAADIKKIYGKTYAWNQIVSSNQTVTIQGTISSVTYVSGKYNNWSAIQSHKYYITSRFTTTNITNITRFSIVPTGGAAAGQGSVIATTDVSISFIFTSPSTASYNCEFRVIGEQGASVNVTVNNINFVDLTLLYGSAIDGMTDSQILSKFESEFPGYHDYNAGELISNDTKELETVGFNLWDEEWELGGYIWSTGKKTDLTDRIRNKNKIIVFPNTEYFIKSPILSYVLYYDYDSNYLGYESLNNHLFTTPQNCYYINIVQQTTVYNNDICINLSDTAKNGTYEPYEKHTLPLNLNSFQVKDASGNTITIEGGLKSAGNVYDEIVGNKYIKRVGMVDMTGCTRTSASDTYLFQKKAPGIKSPSNAIERLRGIICNSYAVSTSGALDSSINDKSILHNGNYVYIRDTSYSTAESFISDKGTSTIVYYELDTPITYELVSPLITEYPVDKNGTERAVYENETDVHAPLVADIQYGVNNNDTAANISDLSALSTILTTMTRRVRRTSFDLNVLKQAVAEQNLEKYGLKVGDETTINGYTYVIAGLNPMAGTSTPYRVNVPHVGLIVIPHTTQAWNVAGNTYTGADGRGAGYMNCDLHYYLKNTTLPHVQNDLGSGNLIAHSKILSSAVNTTGYNRFGTNTGCASSRAWESNCYISALSEIQVYGSIVWSSAGCDTGEACRQLDVFRVYNMNEIFKGEYPWLRDIASASYAATVRHFGSTSYNTPSAADSVAALILFH